MSIECMSCAICKTSMLKEEYLLYLPCYLWSEDFENHFSPTLKYKSLGKVHQCVIKPVTQIRGFY